MKTESFMRTTSPRISEGLAPQCHPHAELGPDSLSHCISKDAIQAYGGQAEGQYGEADQKIGNVAANAE